MSTTYHHGNLRAALVEAALEAVREHGPDGLAVRDLARRVGVSHNAAYRHFAHRDALVAVVAENALAALTAAGRARLAQVRDADPTMLARRRLFELGRSYVAFALAEPGLFRVAFTSYPQIQSPPGLSEPADATDPFGQLNTVLDGLVDVGFLARDARPGAEVTCWSAVHGFAVLHLEGPLRALPVELRDRALDQMLIAIDRGYGATTGNLAPLR
ncbi:MAG: TetR/AcrR family transcriptional regulator [Nocardioidaceae bacterium]|nr:TetR/AcrR family transcriptional regulator [Nocardioidaceae bacterium]